jgi:hypothetical protein
MTISTIINGAVASLLPLAASQMVKLAPTGETNLFLGITMH